MAESEDSDEIKLAPQRPVSKPLPRLWKAQDEEEDVDDPATAKAKKKEAAADEAAAEKAAKGGKARRPAKKPEKPAKKSGGKGGVLLEETPSLDTYESRQRARAILGVVASLLVFGTGYGVYKAFAPAPAAVEEQPIDPSLAVVGTPASPKERSDQEARLLMDRAKESAKTGNTKLAVSLLKKVTTSYAATPAATEAREALDRPSKNLPLFLDRPAVVASPDAQTPKPAPTPVEPPKVVVNATPTNTPATQGAVATIAPPTNAPEAGAPVVPGVAAAGPASKPLPPGFHVRPDSAVHPSGWPLEIVGDRDGAPMLFIASATFLQGHDESAPEEGPEHKVVLASYYIDRHEVTVRQFNLYQKEAGKKADRVRALARDPALKSIDQDDTRPVVMVTAREASDYASWAGKRLPTEAQWEAAGRSPDGRLYPWGKEDTKISPRMPKQIYEVMTFPADVSPYGVSDLAGNAWEWTKDWYDARYYQEFRTQIAENPLGAVRPKSQQLVVKGSSEVWKLFTRVPQKSDTRLPYLGFRCVLQVEGPGNAFEPPAPVAPRNTLPPGTAPGLGGAPVPF